MRLRWGWPSPSARRAGRLGRGRTAGLYCNLGERYLTARTATARDFLSALVNELFPKPAVAVTGSHAVDVSVMRQPSQLLVNLVNTAGPHADTSHYVFDEVPPVGPLRVTIRSATKPGKVTLEPGGRRLTFEHRDGETQVVVPQVDIHRIVVVE